MSSGISRSRIGEFHHSRNCRCFRPRDQFRQAAAAIELSSTFAAIIGYTRSPRSEFGGRARARFRSLAETRPRERSPMSQTGSEIVELTRDVSSSAYYSRDLAPVPKSGRRWGTRDLAVLWISMSACIPTYMLASGLIDEGMNWKQAVATIFLGNCVVLLP